MLKKIIVFIFILGFISKINAQVLYSERFNNIVGLKTGTYTANSTLQTYLYSNVTSSLTSINNGNLMADTLTGNYPFKAPFQSKKGWLAYRPANITTITDTFAVSTSWLLPDGIAEAWLMTPTIYNIKDNTVLTWEAMAPDANFLDGYEVYISTNTTTTTPVIADFTTPTYTIAAEKNTWKKHGISLKAFSGKNIRIAFKNNSNNKYQLWLDDIIVQNVANEIDLVGISNETYRYGVVNINNSIIGTFQNNGYAPISSMTINYKAGNNAIVSEIKNISPPLNYLGVQQFTVSIPLIATLPSYNDLKIWGSSINGVVDQLPNNDTIKGGITISSQFPAKKVIIEEFTSATNGWCPDGYTKLYTMDTASANANVIFASIHDKDNMAIPTGTLLSATNNNGFPSAMIDRYYFPSYGKLAIDRNNWKTYLQQRKIMAIPATVTISSVSYNSITRQISATVSSTFVGDVKGDYRLNLYIKENNVYGPKNDFTDNNWNQHSYLYNIPTSPYYQIGSLLNSGSNSAVYLMNANEFKHQYVIDEIMDGSDGAANIIPTNSTTINQTFSKTYTYTLPTAIGGEFRYNFQNVYLIATLSENIGASKTILNSAEIKLTTDPEIAIGIEDIVKSDFQLNLFPNPANDMCTLNYSLAEKQNVKVSIYNLLGEIVHMESLNTSIGNTSQVLNLEKLRSGNYSVEVTFNNIKVCKKLIIIK